MAIDTRFDSKAGILWLVLEGEIDFQDVMRTLTDLYRTESYPRRIWDLRKATNHPSPREREALAAALRHLSRDRHIRSALLTSTDLQYGMSRALQPRLDDRTIALGVFKSEAEAVAWVTAQPAQEGTGS